MNKNHIEHISTISKLEKWPYPKTFKTLKEAGVLSYKVEVSNHRTVFYSMDEHFEEAVPKGFQPLAISQSYNLDLLKTALRNSQSGKIDYEQFLKEIAHAGVKRYLVEMPLNKITYFGAKSGEEYTENIPQI